ARTERYIEWGLKRRTNEEARRQYIAEVDPQIEALGLVIPNKLQGRKYLYSGGGSEGGNAPLSSLQPRDRPRRFASCGRPWRPSGDPLRGPHAHVCGARPPGGP